MEKIIDNTKDFISQFTNSFSEKFSLDFMSGFKEMGTDRLNSFWKELEEGSTSLARTGYTITDIHIKLGLPPTIAMCLDQVEVISEELEKELLEENKSKPIVYAIMVSLFKANSMQKTIHSSNFKFTGLTMEMGLTPSMEMKFSKL